MEDGTANGCVPLRYAIWRHPCLPRIGLDRTVGLCATVRSGGSELVAQRRGEADQPHAGGGVRIYLDHLPPHRLWRAGPEEPRHPEDRRHRAGLRMADASVLFSLLPRDLAIACGGYR